MATEAAARPGLRRRLGLGNRGGFVVIGVVTLVNFRLLRYDVGY